uniref:TIGR02530 family flagellar biosynthesis protein n=1 Tax=Agathobacter sp. TaxID=2021311 RepID=UPI0040574647
MNQISNQFISIEQIRDQYLQNTQVNKTELSADKSFENVLRQKQNESVMESSALKFSKHAVNRLNDRNILLTDSQNARLENGVKQANEKGIQESLVLVDSLAFIVNVPNKTVVTAMEQTETNSKVFTNIDGAVII